MEGAQPIIVKKIKKGGGDGHHGGAWKVAYADFVTAMMAFFLLMWLLNATSEDQRKGLADFFDPQLPISRVSAGGAGMLGGEDIFVEPETTGTRDEGVRPKPTSKERGEDLGDLEASPDKEVADTSPSTLPYTGDQQEETDNEPQEVKTRLGQEGEEVEGKGKPGDEGDELEGLAASLQGEFQALGADGLLEHFSMRITPEGLVIELADITGDPLFQSGSPKPAAIMAQLVEILVPVLQTTTNDIALAGHTDASPFASNDTYSNWELSADRANAARRLITQAGLEAERIVRVSGRAASDPIDPDPFAARNRRIAVTILRESL